MHTARLTDGSRKVVSISELAGMEGDTIMLQDLFLYQRDGVDADGRIIGHFLSTGIRPRFLEHLKATSEVVDLSVFDYPTT